MEYLEENNSLYTDLSREYSKCKLAYQRKQQWDQLKQRSIITRGAVRRGMAVAVTAVHSFPLGVRSSRRDDTSVHFHHDPSIPY